MCVTGRVNAKAFTEFLGRLLVGARHPIFLIVDGHPTHKAKATHRFVASTAGRLRLRSLPPYSPEINPDEHVWNDLKSNAIGRTAITGPDQMKREVLSHVRRFQRLPMRVRSFFRAPTTAHAA